MNYNKVSEPLNWVRTTMSALLINLLLIRGGIEKNPGPDMGVQEGKYYTIVQYTRMILYELYGD